MDDRELVERFREGDAEAGRRLWEQHGSLLFNLALQKLNGHREDAEDAVVETFLALAEYRKPIRNLRGWLKTVVERAAVSEVRRLKPRLTDEQHEHLRDSRTQEEAEYREALHQWNSVLRALTEAEQRVMRLTVLGEESGWTNAEQARALGISTPVYFQRRTRARKRVEDAVLLLHLVRRRPACQELRDLLGVPEGGDDARLTPASLEDGTAHLRTCGVCGTDQENLRHLRKLPVALLAPSPELYDRVRTVCDARRPENDPGEARRETSRSDARTARRDAPPSAPRLARPQRPRRRQVRRRPRRALGRAATTLGAGALASIVALTVIDKSGADIALPDFGTLPGIGATAEPGTPGGGTDGGGANGGGNGGSSRGGTNGGGSDGGGGNGGGTSEGNTSQGTSEGNTSEGNTNEGTSDGGTSEGNTNEGNTNEGNTNEGNTNEGTGNGGVVEPPPDTTGPSVSLTGLSADAVGQEVVDTHGSLMQTCGPDGTPTTYSVWLSASDPSGILRLTLYIEHPTDGTYESSDWIADGDTARFDIPAYRTGPKALETVPLHLYATAKDMNGNRTDADLGTLPLYECGEPG
ncbi:sigma-70 family RNA polymerase sigma factor [Streptomyces sp. NPDC001595]|uniref:RNA polymerase sigma factor n=1 Tax=Streptomyces sp. NPDC001532 TaxID=3154520 RepID=UPI003316E259